MTLRTQKVATLLVATLSLILTAQAACASETPTAPATEIPAKFPEIREEVGGRELYISKDVLLATARMLRAQQLPQLYRDTTQRW